MKSLLLALTLAVASLCPVQTCHAITSNLLGRWTDKTVTFYQGQKLTGTGTTTIQRFETLGVSMRSSVRITGQPRATGRIWLYDSGEVYGEMFQSGIMFGTVTGTWSEAGNRLYMSASVSTLYADYTQDVTYIIRGRKKVDSSSTTSIGVRGVAVMTRK